MPTGSNESTTGTVAEHSQGPQLRTRTVHGSAPAAPRALGNWRGARIDRYVVIERLGSGGMGDVYLAYDPELDRRVAIKLLRQRSKGDDDESRERLLGEAQALARLAHQNVVAVHDVGTAAVAPPASGSSEGDAHAPPSQPLVFVAMEFVDGLTVSQWRARAHPGWREIVEVFIAAGEGLAAAHRAGIVHRDFKPTNVMVTPGPAAQRRVRVLDFGLARRFDERDPPAAEKEESSDDDSGRVQRESLTEPGFVMGTPPYMAPEQLMGEEADAASDQYSFCVSLYEALFGRRPFDASSFEELARIVPRVSPAEPPANTKVPRRIRAAVMRGLATRRSDRFASIDALLQELRRTIGPRGARARWLAVGGLAAGAMAWGAVTWFGEAPCAGAERKLIGVWDADKKQAVAAAFEATNMAFSQEARRGVEDVLDAYAEAWVERHRDACEATRVRGEQSEELMDLRIACLGQRLGALGSLTDLYADADAAVVEHALEAAQSLPALASCDDSEYLRAAVKPPADPRRAAQVEELRHRLQRAEALRYAGKYDEALALADEVLEEARAIEYQPLVVDAALAIGLLHDGVGRGPEALEHFAEALDISARIGHARGEAQALAEMVRWSGTHEGDADSAFRYARFARAVMHRAGPSAVFEVQVELNLANAYFQTGRYEAAVEHAQRVVELAGDHPAAQHHKLTALQNIGAIEGARGNMQASVAALQEALRQHVERLGPNHPSIAVISSNLAASLIQVHQYDEAETHVQRAEDIWTATFGPEHPSVARALQSRATILAKRGQLDEALEVINRALEIKQAGLAPDDPSLGYAHSVRGDLLLELGRHDQARQEFERALQTFEAALGPEHGAVGHILLSLGRVDLATGQRARALERLERALAVMQAREMSAGSIGKVELALARALVDVDPTRAESMARQARSHFAEQPQAAAEELEEVDAWLRTRAAAAAEAR